VLSLALLVTLAQAGPPARISLVFGGDVIPHEPVKFVARMHDKKDGEGRSLNAGGWDQIFGPLSPIFRRNDVAVVNLESPAGAFATPELGEKTFHAPGQLLEGLARAGVTVATFANNHCLDQRREGISATRKALREAGLLTAGAAGTEAEAWQPLRIEKHGLRVGLLAVTRWLNGYQNARNPLVPHVPTVPYRAEPIVGGRSAEALAELVRHAAADFDVLLVSVHWGEEYAAAPGEEDRALARALLEAGAAAVIGHHPHVLQKVEWLTRANGERGLVAFSLGNLVSNQDYDNAAGLKRDSLLLELTFERAAPGEPTRLTEVSGVPVATENRPGRGRERSVQPVLLDEEIAAMVERLDALAARRLPADRGEVAALQKRLALARARLERIHAVLGPAAALAGRAPPPG
jgi:poly-gamma-glutamate synthesis protein (capsule biosynthesis protein)